MKKYIHIYSIIIYKISCLSSLSLLECLHLCILYIIVRICYFVCLFFGFLSAMTKFCRKMTAKKSHIFLNFKQVIKIRYYQGQLIIKGTNLLTPLEAINRPLP